MGRNFQRRIAFAVLTLFLFVFGAGAAVSALILGVGRGGLWTVAAAVAGVLLLMLMLSIAGRTARGVAAPIGEVMEAAQRLAAGDYGVRVDGRGPRDVRGLARAFNAMAERLQANEERRRNLLADVAHELRTPLAVIRGNAEGLLDGVYPADEAHLTPLVEETVILARLLDDLATLSTAEAGALPLYRERVSPAELVGESLAAFRPQADAARIALTAVARLGLLSSMWIPSGFAVLDNLISNALQHTPAGGSITVSVASNDTGRIGFDVIDTGSGIPPDNCPSSLSGSVARQTLVAPALGWRSRKSLVEAHGGTIAAESAEAWAPGYTSSC
jgi:two-component system sensor histidine kinase BaeS